MAVNAAAAHAVGVDAADRESGFAPVVHFGTTGDDATTVLEPAALRVELIAITLCLQMAVGDMFAPGLRAIAATSMTTFAGQRPTGHCDLLY